MVSKITKKNKQGCYFCQSGKVPYFADTADLEKFLTDRGKIISRKRSGSCAKDQRKLTKAVKQARFLALLPYGKASFR